MKPSVTVIVLLVIIVGLSLSLLNVTNRKQKVDTPTVFVSEPTRGTIPTHTEYLKSSLKIRPNAKYDGVLRFNSLTPQILASNAKLNKPKNESNTGKEWDSLNCERWAIVTTINAPTTSVLKQAHVTTADAKFSDGVHAGWCLLVVADSGSPDEYALDIPNNKFVYLSVARQKLLADTASDAQKELYKALPWGHVGRKNAGYLYAIRHGARYIYDFDDDMLLLSKHHTITVPGEVLDHASKGISTSDMFAARVPSLPYDAEVLNPFPFFDANHNPSWPRGFPSERILRNISTHDAPIVVAHVKVASSSIGVVQYLANHDPDVDSLYRLVRPLPLDFPLHGVAPLILPPQSSSAVDASGGVAGSVSSRKLTDEDAPIAASIRTTVGGAGVVASPGSGGGSGGVESVKPTTPSPAIVAATTIAPYTHTVFAPYNSQSTLHSHSALFALLLPLTSHPRVSDIWRSYIAQRVFAEIGVRVAFHSPISAHIRTAKESDLPDMLSELPLYADSLAFIKLLRAYKGTASTVPGRMEELYVHLYEQGFVGVEDVNLVQKWIAALIECGYQFPTVLV